MGRRKKGRDLTGWLVLDKPPGITSNKALVDVRRALDAKKAGHAGTLDPAATGVLTIAFGEATKTIPYITDALKAYDFTVRLGIATNTDDAEGEVIDTSPERPSDEAIADALEPFRGDIDQVPPAFSAVKIDGKRAYAAARDGEDVELDPRPLHVAELSLIERPDPDHAILRMVCGKGGYVRSIARDLGAALGCFGHVTQLRRTWSGPFTLDDAVSLEDIHAETDLLPLEIALQDLPEARCTELGATRLRNGNPGEITHTTAAFGDEAWASRDGQAVAVGTYRGGMLHPSRVFLT
ncbi:MAG: tRNA pseudouridine(55) synthase TruB [Pseudomonadota bacterium]